MDKLDLSKCGNNSEIIVAISERVHSIPLSKVQKDLGRQFFKHSVTIEKLYTALATGNNVILYGPGGFGKSVIVKSFCEYFKIPVFVKVGHSSMTIEELIGVPNMTELLEESNYTVEFKNSIFSEKGILLFEEGLDVPSEINKSLKDIITEGGLRDKNGKKHSFIGNIIITGNEDVDEICNSNVSLKAFYQDRFRIRHRVVWDSVRSQDYVDFLRLVLGDKDMDMEYRLIGSLCGNTASLVSPRIALSAAKAVKILGVSSLKNFSDLNTDNLKIFEKELAETKISSEQESFIEDYREKLRSLSISNVKSSFKRIIGFFKLKGMLILLRNKSVTDNLINDKIKLIEETKCLIEDYENTE